MDVKELTPVEEKEVEVAVAEDTNTVVEVPKISSGTIIRFVLLGLSLINMILETSGKSPLPISNEQVSDFITIGFVIVTALLSAWKDNDITKTARANKAKIKG